ncbi:LPP20 family lipoprotein [Mucispirillum schaedleri]|jgi:hypothetical protein|uniref:Uncharacterized protein n=1 Tax=Mucispirillum schaedleri ASF457 TaxID=1379858 RepID=V2QBI5_9BACT|nr:LPP20 family lipoprotein [Mucispirillum schaedleri]MCX4360269.1 LPP20 family lipoprotein [Mucispirillum schaedleri]USF24420.1 hypothetical protein N508_001506 [Mucispirillum schaedleri ASF457]SIW07006.1 conserved exported hypothetical protein [Mucispirillum schaedleri ASF457]
MNKLILFLFMCLISFNAYSADLQGIGYGSTMEEAKQEALSDLSASVKVQVYSKHEQTTYKNKNKIKSDYTRWTKLSTNVPLLNPSIYYSKENGKHKATAVIDNPALYSKKLTDIAERIDEMTKNIKTGSDKTLNYRVLKSVQSLYDEYESYQAVADVLGIKDYLLPRISSAEALKMILEMQETPPSLEVAAEVLTKDMNEKNIYVAPVMYAGKENITEFGAFFKDMLSTKVNSVEVEEDGRNKLRCSYTQSGNDIIMACSLITGISKVLKSSAVKIPKELVTMQAVPKTDTSSILNTYTPLKTDYKIWIKISTDGDPTFLRENEPFTLFVKANKAGYIYFITMNNAVDGEANILPLDWNNKFIKYIDEKNINKWVCIGHYRVKAPFGSESLYAFGLEKEPMAEYIVPEYTLDKIGYLKNVRPEVLLQDVLYLFKRQQGDKTMTSITFTTAPNRKKMQ